MSLTGIIRKTINYARRNGVADAAVAAGERLKEQAQDRSYRRHTASPAALAEQRRQYERMESGEAPETVLPSARRGSRMPLISVLVPAYETPEQFLRPLLESVLDQSYGHFELIVADASISAGVESVVAACGDPRVRYLRLAENGGISRNTNEAAAAAMGDYVALLDHDDLLEPDALFEVATAILRSDCEIVYTDEDKCDEKGTRFFEVNRKPDFNLDYFLANNYICHLLVMRRELFLALKLRPEYDGAQDYDLLLRAPKSSIVHIPKVLYHWRISEKSTAGDPGNKSYASEAGRRALSAYFTAANIPASVRHSRHRGFYVVDYEPDLFSARSEVGIVGGKVLDRRQRIIGGMMDEEGKVCFLGLHRMESGRNHRADTRQTAVAVDARCMKIRPELYYLYEDIFGQPVGAPLSAADEAEADEIRRRSLRFCRQAAEIGYTTVFEPAMTAVDAGGTRNVGPRKGAPRPDKLKLPKLPISFGRGKK